MIGSDSESQSPINRRVFNQLAITAFGGVVAGTMVGCTKEDNGKNFARQGNSHEPEPPIGDPNAPPVFAKVDNDWLGEHHVCRGLNACKGKGSGGENECAGQGSCETIEPHTCRGNNKCMYQGGCGATAGRNACTGHGKCFVPLASDDLWWKVRKYYELAMVKAGKEFGYPPGVEPLVEDNAESKDQDAGIKEKEDLKSADPEKKTLPTQK